MPGLSHAAWRRLPADIFQYHARSMQCNTMFRNASQFLCQCDIFITVQRKVWRKSYLDPADIDHATVRDLERFIKKSHRFTQKP